MFVQYIIFIEGSSSLLGSFKWNHCICKLTVNQLLDQEWRDGESGVRVRSSLLMIPVKHQMRSGEEQQKSEHLSLLKLWHASQLLSFTYKTMHSMSSSNYGWLARCITTNKTVTRKTSRLYSLLCLIKYKTKKMMTWTKAKTETKFKGFLHL